MTLGIPSDLNDAIGRLKAIDGMPALVAFKSAAKIQDVIEEQYALGLDPYADPWAPLAEATIDKGRSPPPLTDTGDMRGGTMVEVDGNDIKITVPNPGGYHQTGTRYMPARKVIPDGEMPPAYELAIVQAATEEWERLSK